MWHRILYDLLILYLTLLGHKVVSLDLLYFNSFVLPSKQLEVDRADRVTLFPHFMERKGNNERKGKDSYHSISIWGILYDAADKAIKQHSEKVQAIRKFYSWCCCL